MRVVIVANPDERANDRQLVRDSSEPRHQFADVDARHVRRDRLKLAPDLRWCLRLHIERVDRAQPTFQKQVDDRQTGILQDGRILLGTSRQEPAQVQSAAE